MAVILVSLHPSAPLFIRCPSGALSRHRLPSSLETAGRNIVARHPLSAQTATDIRGLPQLRRLLVLESGPYAANDRTAGEAEVELPGKKVVRLMVLDLVDFRLQIARHSDLAETIDAEARRRTQENK
jgi:hypothetical protein